MAVTLDPPKQYRADYEQSRVTINGFGECDLSEPVAISVGIPPKRNPTPVMKPRAEITSVEPDPSIPMSAVKRDPNNKPV